MQPTDAITVLRYCRTTNKRVIYALFATVQNQRPACMATAAKVVCKGCGRGVSERTIRRHRETGCTSRATYNSRAPAAPMQVLDCVVIPDGPQVGALSRGGEEESSQAISMGHAEDHDGGHQTPIEPDSYIDPTAKVAPFRDMDTGQCSDASCESDRPPSRCRASDSEGSSSDESDGQPHDRDVPDNGESRLELRPGRYFVNGHFPTRDYRPEGYAPGTISLPRLDFESLKLVFLDPSAANCFLIRFVRLGVVLVIKCQPPIYSRSRFYKTKLYLMPMTVLRMSATASNTMLWWTSMYSLRAHRLGRVDQKISPTITTQPWTLSGYRTTMSLFSAACAVRATHKTT